MRQTKKSQQRCWDLLVRVCLIARIFGPMSITELDFEQLQRHVAQISLKLRRRGNVKIPAIIKGGSTQYFPYCRFMLLELIWPIRNRVFEKTLRPIKGSLQDEMPYRYTDKIQTLLPFF